MKQSMSKADLLALANQELQKHPSYKPGLTISDARMEKHILVLEADGMLEPGVDLEAINEFGKAFAEKYTLAE